VEFTDEGVRTAMKLGEGLIRWAQLSAIKNYSGCFVFEDQGEEILILPKRHFSANELIILQSEGTRLANMAHAEGPDNKQLQRTKPAQATEPRR